jgi:putative tricarboxylic transport membrane protein
MRTGDLAAGVVVLAVAGVLWWQSARIPAPPLIPIGPSFYPRVVLGAFAILGTVLLIQALGPGAAAPRPAAGRPSARRGLVALCFALFALYTLALPWLGYRLSTGLFVAATQWSLGTRSLRSAGPCVLVGAAAALGTYAVFQFYLRLLLPRGLLVP